MSVSHVLWPHTPPTLRRRLRRGADRRRGVRKREGCQQRHASTGGAPITNHGVGAGTFPRRCAAPPQGQAPKGAATVNDKVVQH